MHQCIVSVRREVEMEEPHGKLGQVSINLFYTAIPSIFLVAEAVDSHRCNKSLCRDQHPLRSNRLFKSHLDLKKDSERMLVPTNIFEFHHSRKEHSVDSMLGLV